MITRSMLILIRCTSSTSGANVSSSVAGLNTTVYLMFGLFGEIDSTLGWVISTLGWVILRVQQISCQELFMAVAVKAIIRTVSGIRLLTSPRFANSFRKFSPLQRVKYNRCSSNSTLICIAVKCTVIRIFKSLTIS